MNRNSKEQTGTNPPSTELHAHIADDSLLTTAYWFAVTRPDFSAEIDTQKALKEDDEEIETEAEDEMPADYLGEEVKLISDEELDSLDALMDLDDEVGIYFKQMAKYPLIDHEQEVALAKRIELGVEAQKILNDPEVSQDDYTDPELQQLHVMIADAKVAKEELARANTRLVISIAKRYMNQGLHFLDVIQEGNVGLMRGVKKFEWRRGNKFSTYATWWIRQAITRALSQKVRIIRLPLHRVEKTRMVFKFFREFAQLESREPTYEEITEHTGFSKEQIIDLLRTNQNIASLDAEHRSPGSDEGSTLMDYLEDDTYISPELAAAHLIRDERIKEAFTHLTRRQQDILIRRFGLNQSSPQGDEEQTLQEVADVYGISRERIRQLEKEALKTLRSYHVAPLLRDLED